MKIEIFDRRKGEMVEEPVLGGGLLRLAYEGALSPLVRNTLLRTGAVSRLLGWYCDTGWSKRKIDRVIDELEIDMGDFETPTGGFRTFNQWFARSLAPGARPFDPDPQSFTSPADCRLTVIPDLDTTTAVPVKGATFRIEDLLQSKSNETKDFRGGSVLICRLCPADYHRYHFPADGHPIDSKDISGRYESVNPVAVAAGIPVFTENRRVVARWSLDAFGPAAFVEVGAFGVGGIVDTHGTEPFRKMDEKGYFRYGGSTLVIVVGPDRLKLDTDLVENSSRGIETLIRTGETLGHSP